MTQKANIELREGQPHKSRAPEATEPSSAWTQIILFLLVSPHLTCVFLLPGSRRFALSHFFTLCVAGRRPWEIWPSEGRDWTPGPSSPHPGAQSSGQPPPLSSAHLGPGPLGHSNPLPALCKLQPWWKQTESMMSLGKLGWKQDRGGRRQDRRAACHLASQSRFACASPSALTATSRGGHQPPCFSPRLGLGGTGAHLVPGGEGAVCVPSTPHALTFICVHSIRPDPVRRDLPALGGASQQVPLLTSGSRL